MLKSILAASRIVVTTAISFAAISSSTFAEERASELKTDVQPGAISVPAFTYPPSALSSDEQQRAYAKSLATPGDGTIPIPQDPKIVQFMRDRVNAMFEQAIPMVRDLYPVETSETVIAGIEAIRVTPKGGVEEINRRRILLNLHGGAFMVGWPSVALLDAIPVAALSGIEVITINYRMYPEAVHPAAIEDLAAVYKEVLKKYPAENIGIFGGSAGGVVTLQAVPWFKAHDLPRPGAIAPLAASFRTAVGDSAIWNFNGGFAKSGHDGTALISKGGYFAEMDRTEGVSDTSPETLQEYPPTLLLAGTRAPELSGAIDAHTKFLKKGVESQLYIIEGGWHSSYSTAPQTPESQDAMRYVARWFDKHLGR